MRLYVIVLIGAVCSTSVYGVLDELFEDLKDVEKFAMRKILPLAQEAILSVDISSQCSGALFKLLRGAREREPWAVKFLTSNGGVPAALAYYGAGSIGHYGQCIHSKYSSPTEDDTESEFTGKFCAMYIKPPDDAMEYVLNITKINGDSAPDLQVPENIDSEYLTIRMRIGVCIPSNCNGEEVTDLLNHLAARYKFQIELRGCRTLADEDKREPVYYVAMFVFFLLVALAVLSTLAEIWGWAKPGGVGCMFSLRMNNKYLFAPVAEKRNMLAFLSGLKAVLAFWVVLGHTYFMLDPYTIYTLREGRDTIQTLFAQVTTTGGFLSVSTFFCISGFLLTHGLLSSPLIASRPPYFVYGMIMIRRYLRLTLPSMAVILFSFAVKAWAHGPMTDNFFRMFTESCSTSWWRALTYTNNFIKIEHMCWYHYWFMSADMQIFLVMAIFGLLMLRVPKTVFICLGACVAFSCFWIIQITQSNGLAVAAIFNAEWARFYNYMNMVYVKSITHAGDFIFGMLAGALYSHGRDIRLSLFARGVSSAVCFLAMFLMMESTLLVYYHVAIPRWVEILYAGFHRAIWCMSCGWLIFLMATKNLVWLSSILSSHILVVLGRLSFGIYLVHVPIMSYFIGTNTTQIQFAHPQLVRIAFGNFAFSAILSYMLHVLVEAPTVQLDCLLFGSPSSLETQAQQKEQTKERKPSKDDLHIIKIAAASTKL